VKAPGAGGEAPQTAAAMAQRHLEMAPGDPTAGRPAGQSSRECSSPLVGAIARWTGSIAQQSWLVQTTPAGARALALRRWIRAKLSASSRLLTNSRSPPRLKA
jgi:hypothetical protein